jgi:hypothetical protein
MLRNGEDLTDSLLDELDELRVVLNSRSYDEALFGSDVLHHELLNASGINVINTSSSSESGVSKSVETVSSSKEELVVLIEGVELSEMIVKLMRLSVLSSSNVSGKDGSGLKSAVDHHLEHIRDVVFDAVSLKVHSLLIVVHGEVSSRHLDHSVVDGLVGVLKSLEVSVLKSEASSRSAGDFISGSDIDQES